MSSEQNPSPDSCEVEELVTEICCNTPSPRYQIRFTWIINDFSLYINKAGEVVHSPTFSADGNDLQWVVNLYPNGTEPYNEKFISLRLKLYSGLTKTIRVKIKMTILNANKELRSTTMIRDYTSNDQHHGWHEFLKRELLLPELLLSNDILTIVCEIAILYDNVKSWISSNSSQFKLEKYNFIQDFRNFFDNPKFADVTFVVDGQEFQAHKAILSARSVVFAAMFEHEMEENRLNRVVITDVDHEIFKQVLRFIYTDEAENLENIAMDLFIVADKYDLQKLKLLCEQSLQTNLSNETAANTLVLADRHNAAQLKAYTREFINRNYTDILETEGWKNMIKRQEELFGVK